MKRFAFLVHAYHVRDVARQVLVKEHQRGFVRLILVIGLVLPPGYTGNHRQ